MLAGQLQIFRDIQIAFAQRQVVTARFPVIVQVHMAETTELLLDQRKLHKSAAGIVPRVKGQRKHRAFKQKLYPVRDKTQLEGTSIFDAYLNIRITYCQRAGFAEGCKLFPVLIEPHRLRLQCRLFVYSIIRISI